MTASDTETLIEFPATLTVKAMGLSSDEFAGLVSSIVREQLNAEQKTDVSTVPSSGGKYLSVRVTFEATDAEQLKRVYRHLHEHPQVLYLL